MKMLEKLEAGIVSMCNISCSGLGCTEKDGSD